MSSGFQYAGIVGAVYRVAYIKSKSISFVEGGISQDTIRDSENNFVNAGFADEDDITVEDSAFNDGDYTIDGVVIDTTITLDAGDDIVSQGAGLAITIYKKALPGDQIGGLSNFTVVENVQKIETTVFGKGILTATTIASSDSNPDYFTDSGNRFKTLQFIKGDIITVSGYTGGNTGNNGDKTIADVSSDGNKITLISTDTLSTVSAGASITIKKKIPVLWETSMPGLYNWTATAEKFWNDLNTNIYDLLGVPQLFRFYDADIYLEGIGYINSPGTVSDINDLVRENVNIIGIGILTPRTV